MGLVIDRRFTWTHRIRAKRPALNALYRLVKTLNSNNKHNKLKTRLLIYKPLIELMWIYSLHLRRNADKVYCWWNKNRILKYDSSKIANTPARIPNLTFHSEQKIKTVHEDAAILCKRFRSRSHSYSNHYISNLGILAIPRDPQRRLRKNWCREIIIQYVRSSRYTPYTRVKFRTPNRNSGSRFSWHTFVSLFH